MDTREVGYIQYIRNFVGNERIYLIYAVAIVLDGAGKVLVGRRYEFDWWDLPGGAKELEESISACLVREVAEETGLRVAIERPLGVYTHPAYNVTYPNGDLVQPWTVAFICRAVGGDLCPDGDEMLSLAYHPPQDLLPHPHAIYDQILRDLPRSTPQTFFYDPPHRTPEARPFFPILRAHIPHAPIVLPGALLLIRDDAGRILVTTRRDISPPTWDIPGGFSDLGETASYTALREIKEETNLTVEIVRALGVYSDPALMYGRYDNGDEVYGVGALFEARVVSGELQADGEETLFAAFKSPDELRAQAYLRPQTRQILDDLTHLEQAPFIH